MNTRVSSDINEAADLLRSGQLVGVPTETVYGLAGNGLDAKVVDAIFKVKERPLFNPLILHLSSLERISDIAVDIPDWAQVLMAKFWPGPLTLVLKKGKAVPFNVTAGRDTVAVRVPDHPVCIELLEKLHFPLAAPSANLFGRISPTRPEHVMRDLHGRIPMILDGGVCRRGLESTILGSDEQGNPILLRKGALIREDIEREIGSVELKNRAYDSPEAPGMLDRHYAPKTLSYLANNLSVAIDFFSDKRVGLISFGPNSYRVSKSIVLSETLDYTEAASKLYAAMHIMDESALDIILFERFPDVGLGSVINDKLERATQPLLKD